MTGPSAYCGGLWLAALASMADMADQAGQQVWELKYFSHFLIKYFSYFLIKY